MLLSQHVLVHSCSPYGLPCMSNYRKIYAFSDQLICSLSNDFYTFLSFSWFMPFGENEKYSQTEIKVWAEWDGWSFSWSFSAVSEWRWSRTDDRRGIWLTRLHSAKWMSLWAPQKLINKIKVNRLSSCFVILQLAAADLAERHKCERNFTRKCIKGMQRSLQRVHHVSVSI